MTDEQSKVKKRIYVSVKELQKKLNNGDLQNVENIVLKDKEGNAVRVDRVALANFLKGISKKLDAVIEKNGIEYKKAENENPVCCENTQNTADLEPLNEENKAETLFEENKVETLTEENQNNDDYILEVDNLKKYFPIETNLFGKVKRYLKAVDDVSFKVKRGTTLGIVGESGCGKTTLGRTILRLYDVDGGKVVFKGDDITHKKKTELMKYRTSLQFIFQDPYSSLPPRMTVGNIIGEAVKVHNIVPKDQIAEYVKNMMIACGLKPSWYDRYPHEFSGGQRQRICIARALAVKPELVICDEPVSALDVSIQAQIINLLKQLQNEMGLTYLFISHDLSVVKYITDNILVMYLGNVMEMGSTKDIFRNPLHPYTQALFSAVPVPDPDTKMNRIILSGDIPSPANPPKGCKFHTRCKNCMKICSQVAPEYREIEKGHFVACHLYDPEENRNQADYEVVGVVKEVAQETVEESKKKKTKNKTNKNNSKK